MSYQVLARKWRPKNFNELQGQEHVSRALINAIESERLHHAYLFTGTRGVGKTTIARILAKCLNCEPNGLTSTPCGECASCVEIDEGRFVDLIEVDAASRTKVDDTRELLDNVQYRPTRGRNKVYLIDEVHMLSNSSFNALLKTLEEPPEHVIFLLATTDPQKLPVTVLSRCLQFHLKHMDEATISKHLDFILRQESIEFEPVALNLIAQSAEGSMRDALSLLDQAIAYGQGKVLETDIRTMLGTIDHQFMEHLLTALAEKDAKKAMQAIDEMSNFPVDFADALKELLSRLHQIAIFQATGVLLDNSAAYIEKYAVNFDAADLQLYYQLGLHARRDLAWAATPKQGLEMALLRMLAFNIAPQSSSAPVSEAKKKASNELDSAKAVTVQSAQTDKQQSQQVSESQPSQAKAAGKAVSNQDEEPPFDFSDYAWVEQGDEEEAVVEGENTAGVVTASGSMVSEPTKIETKTKPELSVNKTKASADPLASLHAALGLGKASVTEPVKEQRPTLSNKAIEDELEETTKQPLALDILDTDSDDYEQLEQQVAEQILEKTQPITISLVQASPPSRSSIDIRADLTDVDDEWTQLIVALDLPGTFHQIAQSSLMVWQSENVMTLSVSPSQDVICTDSAKAGIEKAIIEHFGRTIGFEWRFAEPDKETPAMIFTRKAKEKHQAACDSLNQHPFSQELQQKFAAKLDPETIEYLH